MKQGIGKRTLETELWGKRRNGKSENGPETTISKFPVSCAADKQTTSHGKKKMGEKPDLSNVLFVLTQFSLMVPCLNWTKCSDRVHQRRSYLCTKSDCNACRVSLRPTRVLMTTYSLWSLLLSQEFHFSVSHQEEYYLIFFQRLQKASSWSQHRHRL